MNVNKNRLVNFVLSAITLGSVLFSFSSCEEGEHDYAYCATNNTGHNVYLTYKVTGSSKILYDTLTPGEVDTLCWRYNVTGEDIWDVETSAQIYQFSSIEASIADSAFTEDIRLRSKWGGVKQEGDHGVYNLNLCDSLFSIVNRQYYYSVMNLTGVPVSFSITYMGYKFAYSLANTQSMIFGPIYSKQKYMSDLYTSADKISQITVSSFEGYSGADTLFSNINPNKSSLWEFEKGNINGDSIGVYTLSIEADIFN